MAKSKRKRKQEIQLKKGEQKFWRVVGITLLVLLILLFIGFMMNN